MAFESRPKDGWHPGKGEQVYQRGSPKFVTVVAQLLGDLYLVSWEDRSGRRKQKQILLNDLRPVT